MDADPNCGDRLPAPISNQPSITFLQLLMKSKIESAISRFGRDDGAERERKGPV